ncbi:ABC transporter ATP-binding protein [Skermania piniformis]|uniref:ABC transporter ATP-binding protein/permease n=1 Tax=Skermania pinensis TaxID=39122 RepID=A0ABX8S7U4_9ACTN|nr:ABC transporter ATP-binding protein [Skermania piniformis]QXQ13828.1 ABC transporter ATP-binding protein/permease [Skermania piniformis]
MYGLHQVCEVLVPVVIGVVIDQAVDTGDAAALAFWIAVLAALFVVLSMMWRYGARWLTYAEAGEGCTLRVELASTILRPRGLRTDLRTGELLTIASSDADNASYLLDYIPRIVAAVTATVVSAIVLLVIDVPLGLGVLIGTPVVAYLLQLGAPLIARRVQGRQEAAGRAASVATDLVSGLRPLRGLGAHDVAARRYRVVSQESLAATLSAARTQSGFTAASTTLSNLLAAAIAIAAGWLALDGRISIGQFVTVIGLAQFLIEPLTQLTVVAGWVAEARASADRVAAVFNAPFVLPAAGSAPGAPPHGVDIVGLEHRSLAGLDLAVAPGELVGIVAPQAGDAEALVAVLSGRVAPADYRGSVRVGDVALHRLDHGTGRRPLLVEPHQTDIFSGTIGSNVTAGAADADEGFVGQVLQASAAHDVVAGRSDGLQAAVAERGSSLSGGQRQRVALARALLAQPAILVLHDPTTAIDAVTEQAVADGVAGLRHRPAGEFTTILVTSSPALLATTDRVVLVRDGKVAAVGTHTELSAADADYRQAVLR